MDGTYVLASVVGDVCEMVAHRDKGHREVGLE